MNLRPRKEKKTFALSPTVPEQIAREQNARNPPRMFPQMPFLNKIHHLIISPISQRAPKRRIFLCLRYFAAAACFVIKHSYNFSSPSCFDTYYSLYHRNYSAPLERRKSFSRFRQSLFSYPLCPSSHAVSVSGTRAWCLVYAKFPLQSTRRQCW